MKFKSFTFFLLLLIPLFTSAQTRNCSAMDLLSLQEEANPMIKQNMDAIERHTRAFIENNANSSARNAGIITIPVVVHVVYRNSAQNVSDAQIQSQLDVLNEDFRRMNADADNTWSQAGDSEIEFCLATTAPDGSPTTGITRTSTRKRSFSYSNDGVKFNGSGGIDAWPAGDYMNMWVCNLSNGLLGYAQFPGGAAATDGVVIDYAYFGRGGSAQAPFDLGRTATHEVGHYLNLRHIWGDGGCSVDDGVSDTPLSDASNGGCAVGHVSCGSLDMVENYMDYSDDACMNLYTNGQIARMRALFDNGGARASLLNSNGCGGGTAPTCSDGVQNGDETGVDCGGSSCPDCPTTPTCSDGIQNGNETGVDCGGPDCDPCNTGGTCDTPSGTLASNIKRKRATLNWNAVTAATSYTVEIRTAGSNNWSSSTTTDVLTNASGLNSGVTYEWRVRANCSSGNSDFSSICSFIAGNAGSGACNSNRIASSSIKLYPNPVRDLLNIELNGSISEIRIYDMVGKEIKIIDQPDSEMELNVSNLKAGLYFIRTLDLEGKTQVQKFYISK